VTRIALPTAELLACPGTSLNRNQIVFLQRKENPLKTKIISAPSTRGEKACGAARLYREVVFKLFASEANFVNLTAVPGPRR
jgi:hypothetical protein